MRVLRQEQTHHRLTLIRLIQRKTFSREFTRMGANFSAGNLFPTENVEKHRGGIGGEFVQKWE
jgi:hypothetical protein